MSDMELSPELLCRVFVSRDAQRRLLRGGETAEAHRLSTAPHQRVVGLGLAGLVEVHAEVAAVISSLRARGSGGLAVDALLKLTSRTRTVLCGSHSPWLPEKATPNSPRL